jgi:hypothetical protein
MQGVAFRRSPNQVGYYNRDVFLYGSSYFLNQFLDAGYKVFYYPEILIYKSQR